MRLPFWGLLLLTSVSNAGVIASSDFTAGNEGWRGGDMANVANVANVANGSSLPEHIVTGGNPGGFLRQTDISAWAAYHAPATFVGNLLGAYGGHIGLDLRMGAADPVDTPLVVLHDGTTRINSAQAPRNSMR